MLSEMDAIEATNELNLNIVGTCPYCQDEIEFVWDPEDLDEGWWAHSEDMTPICQIIFYEKPIEISTKSNEPPGWKLNPSTGGLKLNVLRV